ncbi:hypothetical protein ACFV4P_08600 [Kitasatospora sp. NPDC059795]|uniref:hypothetical protein n=1 Tax=Kitasatospora sp. NPDC059795 TaxID=3346949 RepID=UPI00366701DF
MSGRNDFASSSLTRHLVRGGIGFGGIAAAFALMPLTGPLSLLLAPLGLVVLRGCPMCWAIGLAQTLSRGKLRRECHDGQCTLGRARPGP